MTAVSFSKHGRVLGALAAAALLAAAIATGGAAAAQQHGTPAGGYAAYVGGSGKANPKLAPVVIGWVNSEGGPAVESFPDATRGAEATVRMINSELGGIHGHPVKLDTCIIAVSEVEGQRCGQQLAADKAAKAVVFGSVVVGNQSFHAALHGSKPVVGGVSTNPIDSVSKNVYLLLGSSTSSFGPFGTYARRAFPKAKSVAITYANQAGFAVSAAAVAKSMKAVGLHPTLVPYAPTATDLSGPMKQAANADLIVAQCFFDCPATAGALAQLGSKKPVLTAPLITFTNPAQYPGGDYPKWTVGVAQTMLAVSSDPEVQLFRREMTRYGLAPRDQMSVMAQSALIELLATVKVMNQVPYAKLTPAAISAKLKAFDGPLVMGPPKVACGHAEAGSPAVCGNEAQFFTYTGHGKWKRTSGWLEPPKA